MGGCTQKVQATVRDLATEVTETACFVFDKAAKSGPQLSVEQVKKVVHVDSSDSDTDASSCSDSDSDTEACFDSDAECDPGVSSASVAHTTTDVTLSFKVRPTGLSLVIPGTGFRAKPRLWSGLKVMPCETHDIAQRGEGSMKHTSASAFDTANASASSTDEEPLRWLALASGSQEWL